MGCNGSRIFIHIYEVFSGPEKSICIFSRYCTTSPLASSMVAPALPQIAEEFHLVPGSVLEAMTLSVFVLAYAIGPLIFVSKLTT